MNDRDALLRRISAAQFAAWETHLFLDTHPDDEAALQNMNRYRETANELIRDFEKQFGPLTIADVYGDTRFSWLDSPWPWDAERESE